MNDFNTPAQVLAMLINSTNSSSRKNALTSMNAICEAHFQAGQEDFSVPTIGRLCEAQNILSARGLTATDSRPYRDLIGAWANHAAAISAVSLGLLPENHPEHLLNELLTKGVNSRKQRNLRAINKVCRKQHASGAFDFSIETIGLLCENYGILKRASLNSKEFGDHHKLIRAWDAFARPQHLEKIFLSKSPNRYQKSFDTELTWVTRKFPHLEEWRKLAAEWIGGQTTGLGQRIAALTKFFEIYLAHPSVPKDPRVMLTRGLKLPDFIATACKGLKTAQTYNNRIHDMLEWVLLKEFSLIGDDGTRVISPAFQNPIHHLGGGDSRPPDMSVRSPLPYGYIDELRAILASGPSFKDWTYAQTALGADIGEIGRPATDWFEVDESVVDRADPDCVLRVRPRSKGKKRTNILEMWSPVRWVAMLVKLLVPLRTMQVRLLDSGEFDELVYSAGKWQSNERALKPRHGRGHRQQGVLRRQASLGSGDSDEVVLYVNSNKTADRFKSGAAKGYEVPWYEGNSLTDNVYYWLEKLRDWQAKYSPVNRPTRWEELDARHVSLKSELQLLGYPDASFLFRLPEVSGEEHLPVTDGVMEYTWGNLLNELQERLAARGETHADGSPIRLVTIDSKGRVTILFPLHSLRVSLVTALALEGNVPFAIMQKLVGHSRLLMTLYYFKPGATATRAVLANAAALLSAAKGKTISEFLLNTKHDELMQKAVCNSVATFAASLPEHPAARNAAGWMLMHHGLCLVGGNTSELEENSKVGGCHNGGANIGSESTPRYAPVPGGSRNCIRCRWFVTEPHYLPALAAHFNVTAYHFDEARNKSMAAERQLQVLKRKKAEMEAAPDGPLFLQQDELRDAERLWETTMKRFSDLTEDLVACWRLAERCRNILNGTNGNGNQLLIQGTVLDVQAIFEETDSELLQLSGVCESLELYPDLEADKAVIRRSQLLDSALYNEGLSPLFMKLSEDEQLLAGNAFIRRLSAAASPGNHILGTRQVVALIDAGQSLSEQLGVDLNRILSSATTPADTHTLHFTKKGESIGKKY